MAITAIDAELRSVMRVAEGGGLCRRGADASDVNRGHNPADRQKNTDPAKGYRGEHKSKKRIGTATKELRHMRCPLGGSTSLSPP
jgi:hypothetical protein